MAEYVCYENLADRVLGRSVQLYGEGTPVEDMLELEKTNKCSRCQIHSRSEGIPVHLSVLVKGRQVIACERATEE